MTADDLSILRNKVLKCQVQIGLNFADALIEAIDELATLRRRIAHLEDALTLTGHGVLAAAKELL